MIIDSAYFLEIMLGSKPVPKKSQIIIFEYITDDFFENHFTESDFYSKNVPIFRCKTVIFNGTGLLFNFFVCNAVIFPNITNIYMNTHFTDRLCYYRFPRDYWHFTFSNCIPNEYEDYCVISHSEFERILNTYKKEINDSKNIFEKIFYFYREIINKYSQVPTD
jgi:hypothetical protein